MAPFWNEPDPLPSGNLSHSYWKWPSRNSWFTKKNMVMFHSYVWKITIFNGYFHYKSPFSHPIFVCLPGRVNRFLHQIRLGPRANRMAWPEGMLTKASAMGGSCDIEAIVPSNISTHLIGVIKCPHCLKKCQLSLFTRPYVPTPCYIMWSVYAKFDAFPWDLYLKLLQNLTMSKWSCTKK